jgi:hypothetical protein
MIASVKRSLPNILPYPKRAAKGKNFQGKPKTAPFPATLGTDFVFAWPIWYDGMEMKELLALPPSGSA